MSKRIEVTITKFSIRTGEVRGDGETVERHLDSPFTLYEVRSENGDNGQCLWVDYVTSSQLPTYMQALRAGASMAGCLDIREIQA